MREGRLELPLCLQNWILSPVRLPIPPLSPLLKKKEIRASDLGRLPLEDKIFIQDSLDFIVVVKKTLRYSNGFFYNHLCPYSIFRYIIMESGITAELSTQIR